MNETAEERALSLSGPVHAGRSGGQRPGGLRRRHSQRRERAGAAGRRGFRKHAARRVEDACASHQVPLYRISPGSLGHAIGKPGRMVISVPAGRMAEKLLTYFQGH
ncbi:MAG: hypothetical protein ACLUE8_02765 [Lachnospiraceae bacterium]